MTLQKLAARRRGFTLIELLIVIVVIAILALVVIPRVMGASRKAKEATLKGNLHQLRNAIEQFQADVGGYPDKLETLLEPKTSTSVKALDDAGANLTVPANAYQGPYLTKQGGIDGGGIPKNPFTSATDTTVANHWNYITTPGANPVGSVLSKVTGQTLDDKIEYTKL